MAATIRRLRMPLVLFTLAAILLPMGFLFQRLWTSTADTTELLAIKRHGITVARPASQLLATLVDARTAAARGESVDVNAVHAAVERVRTVVSAGNDPLRIQPSWAPIASQIDAASKLTGNKAASGYAGPVRLTQRLLGTIGDSSRVTEDSDIEVLHLVDTALIRIPEAMISAGEIASLAHDRPAKVKDPRPDPTIAVAVDRVTRSAEDINAGLQAGSDAGDKTSEPQLLKPLDEFAAAVDAIRQIAPGAFVTGGPTRNAGEAARVQLHNASVALQMAILNSAEASLSGRTDALSRQRRDALVAAGVGVVATCALVLLRLPRPEASPQASPDRGSPAKQPRHGGGEPDKPDPAAKWIGARELLTTELVHVGRAVRGSRRRQR
jgi:hypothetical protein